jgi:putative flippase GtrA
MKKINKEFITYIVFGVLTTVVNISCYGILTKEFQMDYKIATTIAWFISVLFAFVTNKIYVFNSMSMEIRALIKELFAFLFFRLLSYVVDFGMMIMMVGWFHSEDLAAKIFANIVVVIINYFASKFFIFKPDKNYG